MRTNDQHVRSSRARNAPPPPPPPPPPPRMTKWQRTKRRRTKRRRGSTRRRCGQKNQPSAWAAHSASVAFQLHSRALLAMADHKAQTTLRLVKALLACSGPALSPMPAIVRGGRRAAGRGVADRPFRHRYRHGDDRICRCEPVPVFFLWCGCPCAPPVYHHIRECAFLLGLRHFVFLGHRRRFYRYLLRVVFYNGRLRLL